jgi:hypothetical protein
LFFTKRKRKKLEKEKKKLKEKLSLNMVYKDDILDHGEQGDNEIFSLNKIKTKKVSSLSLSHPSYL